MEQCLSRRLHQRCSCSDRGACAGPGAGKVLGGGGARGGATCRGRRFPETSWQEWGTHGSAPLHGEVVPDGGGGARRSLGLGLLCPGPGPRPLGPVALLVAVSSPPSLPSRRPGPVLPPTGSVPREPSSQGDSSSVGREEAGLPGESTSPSVTSGRDGCPGSPSSVPTPVSWKGPLLGSWGGCSQTRCLAGLAQW